MAAAMTTQEAGLFKSAMVWFRRKMRFRKNRDRKRFSRILVVEFNLADLRQRRE